MMSVLFKLKRTSCVFRVTIIWLLFFIFIKYCPANATATSTTDPVKPITATEYVHILRLRRKDHKGFIQNMLKSEYSKNYKIISMAMERIFEVFAKSNQTLTKHGYSPSDGFPSDLEKQESVISILENCCFVSDIILHFPEISYSVLKKISDWKTSVNWCNAFVNHFVQLTDESIVELMDLVRQEINEEERTPDFINPYYRKVETVGSETKKKPKKRQIKKGPFLTKQEL